jgi:hypothetical protein
MKQIRIGRNQDNDIVIDDSSVSRHHATIVQTTNGFIICDNNSSNGTFINGIRIDDETSLKQNDILKIGTVLVPWKNYFEQHNQKEENKTRVVSEDYNTSTNGVGESPKNNASSFKNNTAAPKKRKKGLIIILSLTAVGIIVVFAALLSRNSTSSSFEESYVYSNPIVEDKFVEFVEKGLFDKTMVGYATITNDSNIPGNVEVIATCSQEGESWDQKEVHYMNPGQTLTLEFEFREVKRLKYNPEFNVVAIAIE